MSWRRHRRQLDPEIAAAHPIRFDTGRPTHSLNRLAHDREADAGTLELLLRMYPLEHAEQAGPVLGLDANAIVSDPDPHAAVTRLRPDPDAGFGPARNELHGVVEQVREYLRQVRLVADDHRQRFRDRDVRARRLQSRVRLDDLAHERIERDRMKGHVASAQTAVGQDIEDQSV